MGAGEISLLERREIEAAILKEVHAVLEEELGEARARELLTRSVKRSAAAFGARKRAEEAGPASLKSLAALLPIWEKGGALQIEVRALDETRYDYDVTSCAYARMYAEMGLKSLGGILSCARDGAFIEGYAPDLVLERPKTIMEGDSVCQFRYRRKSAGPESKAGVAGVADKADKA
ncbi:MAG: L-2-amino-thiazoline-4-carboxylic acid hydrolase [Deltaproteobacteria bacterium]|jgi:hypothetical protein|nr:L-2-amino-thiazoline-4-carboxylic acid hydrolase [Deltaproteobacteria bacterium]